MTTSDHLEAPARRRRHARLIAALTILIGACAEAATAVYQPIAKAPPSQEAVEVNTLPARQLSHTAAPLLDIARQEDELRWPAAAVRELEESERTHRARVVVAQAEEALEEPDPPQEPVAHQVPLPTTQQGAAMDLLQAGDEVAARWRSDPEAALALARGLAVSGEFGVDEILDTAVDATMGAGLLALQDVRTAVDPSLMAQLCLEATPYFVLAIDLASAD
ncbi:hypothetical protein ACFC26_17465 [Kitasatospora purpeofusca]|uniref:hypothetical protein n=1 Tax=Kitasatospora purpeofusca TaxID=67352 RepID=UPI0035E0EC7F